MQVSVFSNEVTGTVVFNEGQNNNNKYDFDLQ